MDLSEGSGVDLFVPRTYEASWCAMVVLALVLLVLALRRWLALRSGDRSFVWLVTLILVPVAGPALFLFATWQAHRPREPRVETSRHRG